MTPRQPADVGWVDVPTSVRAHVRAFAAEHHNVVTAAVAIGIASDSLSRILKHRPVQATTLAIVQKWLRGHRA